MNESGAAIDHELTLITRNIIRDVQNSGAALLNLWVLD